MNRYLKLLFLTILLVSCSESLEISSSITSSSQLSSVNSSVISSSSFSSNKEEKVLLPIVNIKVPSYEVDLTSIVSFPKSLQVTLADNTNIELPVVWERSFVTKKESNLETIKGQIIHDKAYDVSVNVMFIDYKVNGSIENYFSIGNDKIKLYYTKNDEHEIENLFNYLNTQYDETLKFMGLKDIPLIKGYIFPNAREVNNFLRPRMSVPDDALGWGAGLNSEIFVFVSPNNPPEPTHISTIYDIAHHEMVHTIHFYLAKQIPWMKDLESVPTWLGEGLATYLSMSMIMQDIYDPIITSPNFIVSDLNSREVHNLPYAPGGLFIKYLAKTYGNDSFIKYLNTLNFVESFGKNEAQLSKEYQNYYLELKNKNGLNVSYFRLGFNYPEGYNEDNFTQGYIVREERTLIYFEVNKSEENKTAVFNYGYRNNLSFSYAGGRFANEKFYKTKFFIDTTSFGDHFRVNQFGIDRKPGLVVSKIYEGKRIVYVYIKDNDSFENVFKKLPLNLFEKDYNFIYE